MPTITQSYRAPSSLESVEKHRTLALSSVCEGRDTPFFQGGILRPRQTAKALTCLSRVVGERWFDAAAIADGKRRLLDPLITSENGRLRFEGFSGCRSLYARVDLLPDALHVIHQSSGTTNVDFNQPIRTALTRVNDDDALSLCIDENAFLLVHGIEAQFERKVDLPLAWLKGLASIPDIESSCEIITEVSGTALLDLFRSMPRTGNGRDTHWLQTDQTSVRIGRNPSKEAIKITGAKRLLILQDLIPLARKLTIATNPNRDLSLWTLHLDGLRLTLALSPEVWRGFSGEGAALDDLCHESEPELEEILSPYFETSFSAEDAAIAVGVTLPKVRAALGRIASQGQLGYDHHDARWFRRMLPGNPALIRQTNPRLAKAESWVSAGCVTMESRCGDKVRGTVTSDPDTVNRIIIEPDGARCTCFWFGRFGLSRGPCSHILALRLAASLRL